MQQLAVHHSAVAQVDGRDTQWIPAIGDERAFYHYAKRLLDLFLILLTLILLLPLILLISLLIKLDSSGPVLFIQERVGARRRKRAGHIVWEVCNFRVYKFRTMVHGADQSLHQAHIRAFVHGQLPTDSDTGVKLVADPRITCVGHILRKTSLDELPQLLNVLKGEMSLVGPRPVPTYEVAEYQPQHYSRLAALPGITGLWQVKGRGQVSFEEMMAMDLAYVRNKSLWLDLKLLALTGFVVLRGRGAR